MSLRAASVESISGAQTFLYERRWLEHPATERFMCSWHRRICQLSFMKFIGLVELQDKAWKAFLELCNHWEEKSVCV